MWEEIDILQELIKEELIIEKSDCSSYVEIIESLYGRLLEHSYVQEKYLCDVLTREQSYPTGLKLNGDLNIAIPHANSEHVLESGIALSILKNPVEFNRMDDPQEKVKVSIVLLIALKESQKQIKVLEELINLLQDEKFLERLIRQREKGEIVRLFREKNS